MKGIYFNGTDAVYREDLPAPVRGEKESLVKILLCAVCNTDKEVKKGYRPDFRGVMVNMSMVAVNEISIVGSRCGPFEPALKMLKEGKISLPEIELYECRDFEKAFESKAFKAGIIFGK